MKQIFHLEDSIVMYGIYNSDTLETLIITVHKMHNTTTWNEKIFASKLNYWYHWYLSKDKVGRYAINSLLYLTTLREKYVKMYENCLYVELYVKIELYVSSRQQELRTCKKIGYEFYCKELFLVKHKSKYSCESVIYFGFRL